MEIQPFDMSLFEDAQRRYDLSKGSTVYFYDDRTQRILPACIHESSGEECTPSRSLSFRTSEGYMSAVNLNSRLVWGTTKEEVRRKIEESEQKSAGDKALILAPVSRTLSETRSQVMTLFDPAEEHLIPLDIEQLSHDLTVCMGYSFTRLNITRAGDLVSEGWLSDIVYETLRSDFEHLFGQQQLLFMGVKTMQKQRIPQEIAEQAFDASVQAAIRIAKSFLETHEEHIRVIQAVAQDPSAAAVANTAVDNLRRLRGWKIERL